MSTLSATQPTLLEVSKLYTGDGTPLPLAELLAEQNPILDDIPWKEANQTNGHRMSTRSGLPAAAFRKLNAGVAASKSRYVDVTESCALMSSIGQIDRKLVQLTTNEADFRMKENIGHMTAMNQAFAASLIYGDPTVDPEKFLGLFPRFSDITGPENAENIIDAGGNDTDLASIALVGWGEEGAFGLYPKGTQAGLKHEALIDELVADANGNQYMACRDLFEWDCGIGVKDWRNIARIANIDLSALTKNAASGADLIDLMVQAVELINAPDSVNLAWYMPRKIRGFLRRQIGNRSNTWVTLEQIAGRKVVAFDGIPVRRVDAMVGNEARVV
jgi:hypothetical protein